MNELNIITQNNTPDNLDHEIHIYKQSRGKKIDLIITGLEFSNKDATKTFMSVVKKKFGVGGCHKKMPELDKDKPVFVFTGDLTQKIKTLLISDYGKSDNLIKIHG